MTSERDKASRTKNLTISQGIIDSEKIYKAKRGIINSSPTALCLFVKPCKVPQFTHLCLVELNDKVNHARDRLLEQLKHFGVIFKLHRVKWTILRLLF